MRAAACRAPRVHPYLPLHFLTHAFARLPTSLSVRSAQPCCCVMTAVPRLPPHFFTHASPPLCQVRSALLLRHDCGPALQWCAENRTRLKKVGGSWMDAGWKLLKKVGGSEVTSVIGKPPPSFNRRAHIPSS